MGAVANARDQATVIVHLQCTVEEALRPKTGHANALLEPARLTVKVHHTVVLLGKHAWVMLVHMPVVAQVTIVKALVPQAQAAVVLE